MKSNCDLCGQDSPTPIEAARPYIGDNDPPVVCGNCGFCYVVERRTPEEVAAAWTALWGEDSYTSAWPAVKARLTYVAEWVDQNIGLKGKSVLDIGAGEGTFMNIVANLGATPSGIEPSHRNAEHIQNMGWLCHEGTVEDAEVDERYDIVTVLWTLENTSDCIGFLKKAREFLKPDGHLVVATGSRILTPFKKPLSMYFSDNPADTHCFRFSANSLATALWKSGMRNVKFNRYEDGDLMVARASFVFGVPTEPTPLAQHDDPAEVLEFFEQWSRSFP